MSKPLLIVLSLASTYLFWGTTYLAIHFGLQSFPPFILGGVRFTIAGFILYIFLRLSHIPAPNHQQWISASIIGLLMPALGNGAVSYAQLTVSSSIAALAIATAPIWVAVFSVWFGRSVTNKEWLGIAIGIMGIALLNTGDTLSGDWQSAALLMLAATCWTFGSVWQRQLNLPSGLMGAACQMLTGGIILLVTSLFIGEAWPQSIQPKAWMALAFLIFLGSIVSYSAYLWLLKNVRPLVAISNTFVNPMVAFFVGILFAAEKISIEEYGALVVILLGVVLILTGKRVES